MCAQIVTGPRIISFSRSWAKMSVLHTTQMRPVPGLAHTRFGAGKSEPRARRWRIASRRAQGIIRSWMGRGVVDGGASDGPGRIQGPSTHVDEIARLRQELLIFGAGSL